jgi:hypothetical protein
MIGGGAHAQENANAQYCEALLDMAIQLNRGIAENTQKGSHDLLLTDSLRMAPLLQLSEQAGALVVITSLARLYRCSYRDIPDFEERNVQIANRVRSMLRNSWSLMVR